MRISDWSSDVCSSDLLTWMTDLGSVPVVFKTGIKIRNAIYDYDDTSDNYRYEYIGSLTNEELLRSVQSPSELSYGDTGATVSTITGSDSSEERRVGKECGGTCRSRWCPDH